MNESLPEFALAWMAQWKRAAKELARIREDELRNLQPSDVLNAMSLLDAPPRRTENPHENSLVMEELTPLVEQKDEPWILERLVKIHDSIQEPQRRSRAIAAVY